MPLTLLLCTSAQGRNQRNNALALSQLQCPLRRRGREAGRRCNSKSNLRLRPSLRCGPGTQLFLGVSPFAGRGAFQRGSVAGVLSGRISKTSLAASDDRGCSSLGKEGNQQPIFISKRAGGPSLVRLGPCRSNHRGQQWPTEFELRCFSSGPDSRRHAQACTRVARSAGSPGVLRSRESPPESVVEGMAPHPKRMDPLTRNVRVGASRARKGPRIERCKVFSERGIRSAKSTMRGLIQVGKPATLGDQSVPGNRSLSGSTHRDADGSDGSARRRIGGSRVCPRV